jgi:hypothetical protein
MITVLGENYFIDLDKVEEYLNINGDESISEESSGITETRINIVKFEMIKMLLDTVLSEQDIIDEKLGMKGNSDTSIPFRIAFNSLLNKKLINYY